MRHIRDSLDSALTSSPVLVGRGDLEVGIGVGLHLGVGVGVLELMVVVAQRLDAGHRVAALEHGDAVEVVQLVLQAAAEQAVASISHNSPSKS